MKMSWLLYALLGMLFFSFMILIFKKLTILGLKAPVLLLFVFLFGTVLYGAHLIITKMPVKANYTIIGFLALAALLSYLANFFYVKSIETAPNPAYPATIIGLQAVLIAVGSILFFGSEMTLFKSIGIIFSIIAIIFLSW